MPGSSLSIAGPNIVLNTIVAETLCQFADILEKSKDFNAELDQLIKTTIKKHRRIIFNGNGYDESWIKEAESRGLSNLKNTPEALPAFISDKSIKLFTKHHVFSEAEVRSRCEILLENYCKTLNIEALTMIDMVNKYVLPAAFSYQHELLEVAEKKKTLGISAEAENKVLTKLTELTESTVKRLDFLTTETAEVKRCSDDLFYEAREYRNEVFNAMNLLRMSVDELELIVAKKYWTLPTYAELLYSV